MAGFLLQHYIHDQKTQTGVAVGPMYRPLDGALTIDVTTDVASPLAGKNHVRVLLDDITMVIVSLSTDCSVSPPFVWPSLPQSLLRLVIALLSCVCQLTDAVLPFGSLCGKG